jgi:hypothetical protein
MESLSNDNICYLLGCRIPGNNYVASSAQSVSEVKEGFLRPNN